MKIPALTKTLMITVMMVTKVRAEVYSSVDDMKSVFKLERDIVMELLNLAEKLKTKLNKIQR